MEFVENFANNTTMAMLEENFSGLYERNKILPRLVFYICENQKFFTYSYGKISHRSLTIWPPMLEELRLAVQNHCQCRFNAAVVNLYRDGKDSVGWHADDEIGVHSVIASLSFGATRKFEMKPNGSADVVKSVDLTHGSLLLMKGACQISCSIAYLEPQTPFM